MKEPQRLLADAETSALSRSLLAAGRARREPDGARERVWSAVAMGVAGGVAATVSEGARNSANAGGSAHAVASALAKMKLVIVGGVLVTAAGAGVVALMNREDPVATRPVTIPTPIAVAARDPKPEFVPEVKTAMQPEPVAPSEATTVAPVVSATSIATARRTPTARDTAAAHAAATSSRNLREEAALLQEAREALARGDTGAAGAKLADARARFPDTQLGEERDALEVRVANASGDRARAASLARAFVAHYPDSPLRAGVESLGRATEKP